MKLTRGKLALIAAAVACNALALVTSARSPEVLEEVASEVVPEAVVKSVALTSTQGSPQPIARQELRMPEVTEPSQVLALAKYQPRPVGRKHRAQLQARGCTASRA